MDAKLVSEFARRWPKWFAGLDSNPQQSCLAFGFECGDGWRDLLWRLCEDLEKLKPGENFQVEQVKEKFGGLRFYVSGATGGVYERIDQAEVEAYRTCEYCGTAENVTTEGSWIKTLCKTCREGGQ